VSQLELSAPLPESWALPRVTAILTDVGLYPDLSHIPPQTLRLAQARGTAVHAAIEALTYVYDHDGLHDPELAAYLSAYQKFLHESHYQPARAEILVTHAAWRYRGHLDSVGLMGTTRLVVDVKTGMLGPVDYQLAAYLEAWNAEHPTEPATGAVAIQLKDDGTYRLHEVSLPRAVSVWQAAVVLYYAKREVRR
jgi:hypothetical protein